MERGALVLKRRTDVAYRGLHRSTLDESRSMRPNMRTLIEDYRAAVVSGDGALDDLDVATEFCERARSLGMAGMEVVVFEFISLEDEETLVRSLPMSPPAPADGLVLAGFDVCESVEPYWSTLVQPASDLQLNEFGLVSHAKSAVQIARAFRDAQPDEPVFATRIWLTTP